MRIRPMILAALTIVTLFAPTLPTASAVPDGPRGACVLRITRFVFVPSRVHPGESSKLVLRARNCTDGTLDLTQVGYGKQIPPCPTIDPIGHPVQLGPYERYAPKPLRLIAPDCAGVEVMVVRFTDRNGRIVARDTAKLHIGRGR